jgi:NhaP-type Na+/H+ or K+/H+ antiporter
MVALSRLFSFAIPAAKRHLAWLVGVIGTVAAAVATAFATNLGTPVNAHFS